MANQLEEWRERWNQGDTKFIPELFELAEHYQNTIQEVAEWDEKVYDMFDVRNAMLSALQQKIGGNNNGK